MDTALGHQRQGDIGNIMGAQGNLGIFLSFSIFSQLTLVGLGSDWLTEKKEMETSNFREHDREKGVKKAVSKCQTACRQKPNRRYHHEKDFERKRARGAGEWWQ